MSNLITEETMANQDSTSTTLPTNVEDGRGSRQGNQDIYINSENISLKFNTSSVKISFDVNESENELNKNKNN